MKFNVIQKVLLAVGGVLAIMGIVNDSLLSPFTLGGIGLVAIALGYRKWN